jgi:hypothetical protein
LFHPSRIASNKLVVVLGDPLGSGTGSALYPISAPTRSAPGYTAAGTAASRSRHLGAVAQKRHALIYWVIGASAPPPRWCSATTGRSCGCAHGARSGERVFRAQAAHMTWRNREAGHGPPAPHVPQPYTPGRADQPDGEEVTVGGPRDTAHVARMVREAHSPPAAADVPDHQIRLRHTRF